MGLVTVSNAEMACGNVFAGGASCNPMVQLSPLLRVALAAQVLLEIVMNGLASDTVKAPGGLAERLERWIGPIYPIWRPS